MIVNDRNAPGVYAADAKGDQHLVHPYQGDPYSIADVPDFFSLGRIEEGAPEGETVLVLDRNEIRFLKVLADSYGFDYGESFIEMCLDMHRFADEMAGEDCRFIANF